MSTVILNDLFGKTQLTDFVFDLYFPNYPIKKLREASKEDKNFLYLYYRPEDFHDIISSQDKKFYEEVRNKNCNVLIYHEGFDLFRIPEIFENTLPLDINNEPYWKCVNFFHRHGIDEDRLYFLTSATGYQQDLELLKQRKIPWINAIRPSRSKFCNLPTFLLWGSQKKKLTSQEKSFEKIYASLSNGRPAIHRYEFTRKLWKENLIKYGLVSMCHMKNGDKQFESNLPILFDNQVNLWEKDIDESSIFQKSFLWISNETQMDNKLTLFSEKTIMPILYQNPFVVNGDVGTLAYLQELGFKTFGDFFDESYDLIDNINERQNKIVSIIKDLKNKNLQKLYQQMLPILDHNKDLLINENWLDRLDKFLKS